MSLHPMPNREFYELVDVFGLDVKKEKNGLFPYYVVRLIQQHKIFNLHCQYKSRTRF
jgi:hypothetical protein